MLSKFVLKFWKTMMSLRVKIRIMSEEMEEDAFENNNFLAETLKKSLERLVRVRWNYFSYRIKALA